MLLFVDQKNLAIINIVKNIQARIAKKTLELLKTRSWKSISIHIISKKLKLSEKKIPNKLKNKINLLKNINQYIDSLLIVKTKSIEKSTSRDMIFEIFMIRFDLLNSYRFSISKIFNFFKYNPKNFILLIPTFIDSIEMMAKLSNIKTKGVFGKVTLKGLMIIYFSSFITWLKDESESLDKTMTVLDGHLVRAENILKLLKK